MRAAWWQRASDPAHARGGGGRRRHQASSTPVPAQRARAEIDFFFQQLFARDPALLGGKLPDDKFFHTP
ncbi:putative periplasmic component of ABC-type transport system [Alicycliphilus sp. B1]|nr:putative periplasmic component of ABC-type transport system [Alicycliphilus sp. B1]